MIHLENNSDSSHKLGRSDVSEIQFLDFGS